MNEKKYKLLEKILTFFSVPLVIAIVLFTGDTGATSDLLLLGYEKFNEL